MDAIKDDRLIEYAFDSRWCFFSLSFIGVHVCTGAARETANGAESDDQTTIRWTPRTDDNSNSSSSTNHSNHSSDSNNSNNNSSSSSNERTPIA